MSIANEITRLQSAKQDIKGAIENRGVSVSKSDMINLYADKINSAPYAIRGTFTPEEDTIVFELSGLSFTPKTVYCSCTGFENNAVMNAIDVFSLCKNSYGFIRYYNDNCEKMISNIGLNSSVVQWFDNGIRFDIVQGNIKKVFKAGYTYEYYVTGGFAQ